MATVTKILEANDGLFVIFSDGSRYLAYPTLTNGWQVKDNPNNLRFIEAVGNILMLSFVSPNQRVLAYPSGNKLWFVGPNEGGSGPSSDWVWPLAVPPWNFADGYGMRENPVTHVVSMHWGQDINGGGISGTPIVAASDGVIGRVGHDSSVSYGYYVHIKHPDGSGTFYAHMRDNPTVVEGHTVSMLDVIGVVGTTGSSTGPHLHFNTQSTYYRPNANTNAVDPIDFMAARGAVMP